MLDEDVRCTAVTILGDQVGGRRLEGHELAGGRDRRLPVAGVVPQDAR